MDEKQVHVLPDASGPHRSFCSETDHHHLDVVLVVALDMATPIRKKRNFKALQLQSPSPPVSPVAPEPEPIVIPNPTRQAPAPGGKKRPPPMTLKAPKVATPAENDNSQLLTLAGAGGGGNNSAPNTASPLTSTRRTTYATLSSTLANLDMNAETKFDLKNEDLKELQELGQGNGGSVKKVEHIPTGTIMAKKVLPAGLFAVCVR